MVKQRQAHIAPIKRVGGRSARVVASAHAAVLESLATVGYQKLSIADIAKSAGVHETSIYRRWPTKAQLVSDAIIRNALDAIPVPDTGSFQKDLLTVMRHVLRRLDTPLGAAISQVVASQDQDLTELRRAYWRSRRTVIVPLVARAKERGEIPGSVQSGIVFDLVVGPILLRRIAGQPVTVSYLRTLVTKIIAGLKTDVP
jgi:AcrR family transcriptional regulator